MQWGQNGPASSCSVKDKENIMIEKSWLIARINYRLLSNIMRKMVTE